MPTRYLLLLATFLLSMLLYVDRACISAAKKVVAFDLKLTDEQMGWVFAAFSLGYALCQTPAGLLSDRLGPRRVLALVVCFWSLFTALTGAVYHLWTMLVVRFLFGCGEAGAFPGMARAIYSWLPMGERGLAQGINFSASRLGAAFAFPLVTWMVAELGWRLSFGILGAIGFVWALGWYWWFRNDPQEHRGISDAERNYILQHRQQTSPGDVSGLSVGTLGRSVNMWLLMGQYFASNFTFFFCLTWMPDYLRKTYQLTTIEAGWYAMLPFLAGMLGNWVSGGLVDEIYRRGSWQLSRRLPAMIGFALAAAGLFGCMEMTGVVGAVLCLSVAILGADMTLSPSWSLCIDIGKRHAGTVSGTMNMAGNLGAFLTSLAFPYLRDWTQSVVPFFLVGTGLNLLAIGAWLGTRADRPLEEY